MDTEDSNIWTAASDGKLTEVQNYVANGVSVNAQDEYGYSPLYVLFTPFLGISKLLTRIFDLFCPGMLLLVTAKSRP